MVENANLQEGRQAQGIPGRKILRMVERQEEEGIMLKVGSRVLVTAGASGIGLVIAETFVKNKARVYVCDISDSSLQEATSRFPQVSFVRADVADVKQVDQVFDQIEDKFGGLDVLINNAGIAGPTAAVEKITPEQWARTIAVNLNGQFHCLRRAVPLLKAAGGGSIINISSVAGRLGYPLRAPYAASKWAIVGLSNSLAMELGPHGIRVNALLPGMVAGDRMHRVIEAKAEATGRSFEQVEKELLEGISMRTYTEASDIANMALFLCSQEGCRVSGQAISVCGNTEVL